MSKRYGRNQKRRHREELAQLRADLVAQTAREREALRQRDSYEEQLRFQKEHLKEIADTINQVVSYSALLPPQEAPLREADVNPLRIHLRRHAERPAIGAGALVEDLAIPPLLELDLWELRVFLEQNLATFERLVHVLAPGPGGVTYRVTEAAYRQLMAHKKGLPEVARMLYGELLKALCDPLVGGRRS